MTAEEINKYIEHFLPIWKDGEEINPMPEGVKLTVYCEGNRLEDRGFLENLTTDEMGLEALIAKSWIKQSDLEELSKNIINQG